MGWSFRKSVSFGPLRLNFSKSGVGASVGVKGARVSMNKKSTYLNLGANGIYYRQKIGNGWESRNVLHNEVSESKMKFHDGKGRYDSLTNSRYKDNTYGQASFSPPEKDVPDDEAHGTYGKLLFDKRWIEKRKEIIARDNEACVICKNKESLQVHHRQYHFVKALQKFKAPWEYENRLMITLCERCHTKGHRKFKVPNVYV
jgi:hypothetical protein